MLDLMHMLISGNFGNVSVDPCSLEVQIRVVNYFIDAFTKWVQRQFSIFFLKKNPSVLKLISY